MLTSLARTTLRAVPKSTSAVRSLSTLSPLIYTAVGTSTGSRAAGHAVTKEGNVDLKMAMPAEMGGKAHATSVSDPEQLFSLAYGTCFLSALNAVHGKLNPSLKPLPKSTSVRALISIGNPANGTPGFQLAGQLEILKGPLKEVGLDDAGIQKLVEESHKLCPYSRAIKGNVEVEIRVVEA